MAKFSIQITPVNTNRKIGLKNWETGFRDYLKKEAREVFEYFEQVSGGFVNHKVDISQKRGVHKSKGDLQVIVGVLEPTSGNKIFSYVNWGTGPRLIYPSNSKFLIFQPGYKRATRPGSLRVSPPWERRGSFITSTSVFHPGIKARRFDKLIQVIMQGEMEYEGRKTIARLAKETWRGR